MNLITVKNNYNNNNNNNNTSEEKNINRHVYNIYCIGICVYMYK